MKKLIIFGIILGIFLLSFISASEELVQVCGGDEELLILCSGDEAHSLVVFTINNNIRVNNTAIAESVWEYIARYTHGELIS